MKYSRNIFIIFSLLLFLAVVKSYAIIDPPDNSLALTETETETGEEFERLFSFLGFIRKIDSNPIQLDSISKNKFISTLISLIDCLSPPIPPPKVEF